jgi:cytochrome b
MTPQAESVRVWDIATRLFHWSLVGLFVFCWWSADSDHMDWHLLSGITLLGLLFFRLIWGFIGGSTARFTSFVRSPLVVLRYLLGKASEKKSGHNPIGGYSVIAMLVALVIQCVSGLFATDVDGLNSGPLSDRVSFDQGRFAADLHHQSFNILLVLIGLHILAIAFYLVMQRRNLIWPMVTGKDRAGADALVPAGLLRFVLAALVAAALAWWVANGLRI